jgi:hypothetical protein
MIGASHAHDGGNGGNALEIQGETGGNSFDFGSRRYHQKS